ncbi:hypothetical protein BC826DRAFT_976719 [Russula brevipes]|nr:hypothetical protein BC826DRAFT_976719 [Russula brevipes]
MSSGHLNAQEGPQHEDNVAQAPFDDTQADLILRSGDEVPMQFHVSKSILSVASPIFAGMFSAPSPAWQKSHDGIKIVPLSEDSGTLDLALRHIYPVRAPEVVRSGQMRMLAGFAHKYKVDALEQDVIRYLTEAIVRDPVGVYAIAVTYGYRDIGVKAAQSSLNIPSSRFESPYLQCANAELGLLKYHVACGEAASAVASQRAWFPSTLATSGCSSCVTRDFISDAPVQSPNDMPKNGFPRRYLISPKNLPNEMRRASRFLWNYLQRSAVVLAHHPTAGAVFTEDFVLSEFDCSECPSSTLLDLLSFSRVFEEEVKKAIEQVPLPEDLGDP